MKEETLTTTEANHENTTNGMDETTTTIIKSDKKGNKTNWRYS